MSSTATEACIDLRATAVACIGWAASRLLHITGSPDLKGWVDLAELKGGVEHLADVIREVEYAYSSEGRPEGFAPIAGRTLDLLVVLLLAIDGAAKDPERFILGGSIRVDGACQGAAATVAEDVHAWAERHPPAFELLAQVGGRMPVEEEA